MMATTTGTISSSGLGSGLPVDSLVTQLMALEKQPLNLIDKKEASYNASLSAWGTIKSSLSALQTAAKNLGTPAKMLPLTASTSQSGVLTATADAGSGAAVGNYSIEVTSLAASQKIKTAVGYGATTDVVGTGNITLEVGGYDDSTDPPTFTAKSTKTIPIGSGSNTLAGIRDAINAANGGVTASIINDGKSNYLSLASADSGTANMMRISVDDPSLNALSYNDPSGVSEMEEKVAAKDAVLTIDNVTITKSSNTITDAIQGVTLNLTGTTASGTTNKLTLTKDDAAVKTAVGDFVKAYNDAIGAMSKASAFDAATGKGSTLTGDSTLRTIQSQMRSLLGTAFPGGGKATTLAAVGITTQRDGTLGIDAGKLDKAMSDPGVNMSALFATSGTKRGFASQLDVTLGRILSPVGSLAGHTGSINTSITALEKQRTAINTRLVSVEARYRAQFSALDTAMASMQTTTSYLTQQLAQFSANSSS
ncbi:flagellar filament capping protein FliD [Massilia aerilata]|uniref:Flagellar hook-associated protein 2 n=1 Tax=Massilia aerilata TaxID=453817 RepID=A0ABW0RTN1_9BURK